MDFIWDSKGDVAHYYKEGARTVPAPVSLLPLSLVIVPPFLQHPTPPTLSVAALLSSCLESIDLADPSLTCGHGFLCASSPVYFGFTQGARYWYLRLSPTDGFPISEASSP